MREAIARGAVVCVLALMAAEAGAAPREPVTAEDKVTAPPPKKRPPPPPRLPDKPDAIDPGNSLAELGLVRQADGSYLHVDRAGRFTARFNSNGTVSFADRWKRPGGDSQHGHGFKLPPGGLPGINPLYGMGVTGPTEWILMARGVDLAAKAKTELLEQTHDLRARLAVAWNLDLLEKRLGELEPELLYLWSDHEVDVDRRKQLLFQRWDECDERFDVDPGDVPEDAILKIDEVRRETAEKARRRIEAFIRRHLPRGSKYEYTKEELADLNRRRVSKQTFEPYRRKRAPRATRP